MAVVSKFMLQELYQDTEIFNNLLLTFISQTKKCLIVIIYITDLAKRPYKTI